MSLPPTLIVAGIFSLANFSYMFFLLRAQRADAPIMGVAMAAWPLFLYAVFNLSYSLFAYPAGILSDRVGRKRVIFSGYVLYALVCMGFLWEGEAYSQIVLFFLYGLCYALLEGNQRALATDLSPQELRGTALGLFHTVVGLMALPGSLIAGILWDKGPSLPFVYGGILALAAALGLLFIPGGPPFHGELYMKGPPSFV